MTLLLMISSAAALAATARAVPASPRARLALHLRIMRTQPLHLYYYVDDARGFASLQEHARAIDVLAPQAFWIDSQGSVHGSLPPRIAPIVRQASVSLMPLVFNRAFNRATIHAVLRSGAARRRAVADISHLARLDSVVGVQIDFENIDPADRKRYTGFVGQAAAALHREGKLLSVALPPRFSEQPSGARGPGQSAPGGAWGAAFDYRALGRLADFVTLMAYDHSGRNDPPGPIAGLTWVNSALAYATSRIPSSKILLGIPLYGREWIYAAGKYSTQSVTFPEAHQILAQYSLQPLWNSRWQEPWFQYHAGGALCTVYYEDRRSLLGEIELMRRLHLRGYAAWRIGDEDPALWTVSGISTK